MASELECTAWHEAGHVVALWRLGVPVSEVAVEEESGGYTDPDEAMWDKLSESDAIHAVISGLKAEEANNDQFCVDTAIAMLLGATQDRHIMYVNFQAYWPHLGVTGWQGAYHRAEKFVQDNEDAIRTVASALLAKQGFPKVLNTQEIEDIRKSCDSTK